MDAREWKASMDRIESTLSEIINLLKMESQRWATSPIFSTPPPVSVIALEAKSRTLPPPVSSTPPHVPSLVSAHEPPSPASATTTSSAQTTAPGPVPKFVHVAIHASDPFFPPIYMTQTLKQAPTLGGEDYERPMHAVISYGVRQIAISFLKKNVLFHLPGEDVNNRMIHHLGKEFKRRITTKREAEKREWRPPWQPNKTVSNATARTDWRPPWSSIFRLHILEDKDCSSGRD
ncbi:hypothetical protein HanIR_Chr09g0435251 [Helianthus annuus]|nr:hypothetical protein HanIR_Chr09g0435251 [Helianthus annuus]